MKLKGGQILCETLLREGVDVIFGYPGGAVLPLYDMLTQYPKLRHILVRHELNAAHMAVGYARATGRVGVCLATSGPGATNMVTGIANAMMDSAPVLALTGQVGTPFIGKDAFQETDITGITQPITKHNYLVKKGTDIARTIREAMHIAGTGRPGPVLVDLPKDVLAGEVEFHWPEKIELRGYRPTTQGHPSQIKKAAALLATAKRPLIIAGHGVILSKAYAELKELAEKAQIPVTTTLLGVSCFPESHYLSLSFAGMHGMAFANMAIQHCDLLLGIGIRFDDRLTGDTTTFAPQAEIVHIDIDPAEIGKSVRCDVPIVGDVKTVLQALNAIVESTTHPEWLSQLDDWRREHPSIVLRPTNEYLPQQVMKDLFAETGDEFLLVTDVGQAQQWAAQYFRFDRPNTHITSGGLGTMGFALPAAIGAKVGRPDETVWAITGDGGFQMTMQELATIRQENIGVKIAIVNNGYLGMVRQWQELFYNHNYSHVYIPGPDYLKLGDAYGIPAFRAASTDEAGEAIRRALAVDGPALVEFAVRQEENCYPMVAPGTSLSNVIEAPAWEAEPVG
jgi:acetolactate synthase-1/2/3 large subunit